MKAPTLENILSASATSARAIWEASIRPALDAYEKLRKHAVTAVEIESWQAQYRSMTPRPPKRKAARIIAETSPRSAETIRQHI